MKTFRYFGFGLLAALLVGCTAVTSFAGGGQADERAGYQGIPVRNGLNRGIVAHAHGAAPLLLVPASTARFVASSFRYPRPDWGIGYKSTPPTDIGRVPSR